MSRTVVITTIRDRTEAIRAFEAIPGWRTLVVGDRKTPEIADSESLRFFSLAAQEAAGFEVSRLLPVDHYCRKNAGYLLAVRDGARSVYDTDDDNIPYDHWGVPPFTSARALQGGSKFLNVYRHFTKEDVWPRGFPLDAVREGAGQVAAASPAAPVGVWQAMADGDPDVDAIHRLVLGGEVRFEDAPPVHLERGTYCPFNSQATAWSEQALPFLYLPCTVSFRFTDILRGYVAQRLMWEQGLHLGFTGATVRQERNAHDLMHDFADEVEMYLHTRRVVETLDGLSLHGDPLRDQYDAYTALRDAGVVADREVEILSAWSRDFERNVGGGG